MLFTGGTSKTKEKLNIKERLKFKTAGKHNQGKANKQKMEVGTFLLAQHQERKIPKGIVIL